jgi:hypothetical protein
MVDHPKESEGIRGWLLVYVVALALITVHGMALTIASIIVYTKPPAAGVTSFRGTEIAFAAERLAIVRHN